MKLEQLVFSNFVLGFDFLEHNEVAEIDHFCFLNASYKGFMAIWLVIGNLAPGKYQLVECNNHFSHGVKCNQS